MNEFSSNFLKNKNSEISRQSNIDARQNINNYYIALFQKGRFNCIIEDFSRNDRNRLEDEKIVNFVGLAFNSLGRLDDALLYYEKVTNINDKNADAYSNMGSIYRQKKDFNKAITFLNRAVEIEPDHFIAWNNLGNLFFENGEYSKSLYYYKRALDINPKYCKGNYNIGNAFFRLNKFKEAKSSYRQALLIEPTNPDIIYNLAMLEEEQGNQVEALNLYYDVLNLSPDNVSCVLAIGSLLISQEKFNEAIRFYEKAIVLKSNNTELQNNLGLAFYKNGQFTEAIKHFQKAISISPNFAESHNNLGLLFKKLGNLSKAVKHFKISITLEPKNICSYNNLGNIYKQKHDFCKAKFYYRKVIEIDPNNKIAKFLLNTMEDNKLVCCPGEYVETLFDQYAPRFESHLVKNLKYQVPKNLFALYKANAVNPNPNKILDLGCGSGLLGEVFKEEANYLEGIDISKNMLKQAKNKKIYDKLNLSCVLEFLRKKPLDFDLFIAADFFIYIGNLKEIFFLIRKKNKRSANFLFSTEHRKNGGFGLEHTGRFSHSVQYIKSLSERYGYKLKKFETTKLRKEGEKFLKGDLYFLEFEN